jgi:hypothetical protein
MREGKLLVKQIREINQKLRTAIYYYLFYHSHCYFIYFFPLLWL